MHQLFSAAYIQRRGAYDRQACDALLCVRQVLNGASAVLQLERPEGPSYCKLVRGRLSRRRYVSGQRPGIIAFAMSAPLNLKSAATRVELGQRCQLTKVKRQMRMRA